MFVEAMFRLRTQDSLLSGIRGRDELYIDSEIRLEWRTPLFLLELSLLPDFTNPLYSITTTSIGISWDLNY